MRIEMGVGNDCGGGMRETRSIAFVITLSRTTVPRCPLLCFPRSIPALALTDYPQCMLKAIVGAQLINSIDERYYDSSY